MKGIDVVRRTRATVMTGAALALLIALPATAQESTTTTTAPDELTVTTPFPGVAVEPGDTVGFDLVIGAPSTAGVTLEADGLPEGWTGSFLGGGFEVDRVTAGPGLEPDVTFNVTVPVGVEEGTHDVTVTATAAGSSASLDLTIRVSEQAGGEVTLTPDFPGLRTAAGDEVTFNVTLRNDTPRELQFELSASGPAGWDVSAQPSSQAQASTVAVDAGGSETVNLNVTPPLQVASGQYPISVKATGGDVEVSADVIVEVTGSYSVVLDTADQRLNASVTAGSSSDLALVVTNTGTAPLDGVEVTATPPSNWDVTFEPPAIATLGPGESTVVTATITPSSDAVAGDYQLSFAINHAEASDSIEVRTTVSPSAIWGFVGIAVVALTLAGLAWVFRRFGRR